MAKVKKEEIWSVKKLAGFFHAIVKSDRQGIIGVGGETGAGKSTFLAKFFSEYGLLNSVGWSFDNMTWSRDEMMGWIDGKKDSIINSETGLKENQLPEYSGIMADELLPMFFSDNRFEEDQQKAIATLNMCRDRHLVIGGAVPTFWDLTSKFRGRVSFYAFIPRRGVAWLFEKENNPFAKDPWNTLLNEKLLRNNPNKPWASPNYVCTIRFDDWDGDLKKEYYRIRNVKRLKSLEAMEQKKVKKEKIHKKSIIAFGNLVNNLVSQGFTQKTIAELSNVSTDSVSRWSNIALEYYGKYEN